MGEGEGPRENNCHFYVLSQTELFLFAPNNRQSCLGREGVWSLQCCPADSWVVLRPPLVCGLGQDWGAAGGRAQVCLGLQLWTHHSEFVNLYWFYVSVPSTGLPSSLGRAGITSPLIQDPQGWVECQGHSRCLIHVKENFKVLCLGHTCLP